MRPGLFSGLLHLGPPSSRATQGGQGFGGCWNRFSRSRRGLGGWATSRLTPGGGHPAIPERPARGRGKRPPGARGEARAPPPPPPQRTRAHGAGGGAERKQEVKVSNL